MCRSNFHLLSTSCAIFTFKWRCFSGRQRCFQLVLYVHSNIFFKTFLKLKYQKIRQHLDRNIFDVVWKITLDTDKQIQTCFWKKSALADRETHSLRDKTRRWASQDSQTTAMAGTRLTASTTTWRGSLVHSSYQSASLSASFCLLGQESMGRSWRRWGLTTRARRTTWTASSSVQTLSGMVGSSEHQQTNFREENIILKILCLRVSSEAGGDPPQARHRPGDHHNHCQPQNPPSTLKTQGLIDDTGEHWRAWHCSPLPPPRRGAPMFSTALMVLLKVAATEEVSQRSKEGLFLPRWRKGSSGGPSSSCTATPWSVAIDQCDRIGVLLLTKHFTQEEEEGGEGRSSQEWEDTNKSQLECTVLYCAIQSILLAG